MCFWRFLKIYHRIVFDSIHNSWICEWLIEKKICLKSEIFNNNCKWHFKVINWNMNFYSYGHWTLHISVNNYGDYFDVFFCRCCCFCSSEIEISNNECYTLSFGHHLIHFNPVSCTNIGQIFITSWVFFCEIIYGTASGPKCLKCKYFGH